MLSWLSPPLGTTFEPSPRLERVLAVGRAFLTVSALAAIFLDPTEPARLATLAYGVLAAYAIYSLLVLVFVHRTPRLAPGHGLLLHGLDVLWSSALTFVSEGPTSPFFLFFLFVVLSAAYRWAFAGTLATTAVAIGVYLLQSTVAAVGPWHDTFGVALEVDRVVLRVAYLLLTGFLLGYLAQQDKRSKAELAAIARTTRLPRVDLGLGGSIAAVARGLLHTFSARHVVVVLQDFQTSEAYLWHLDRSQLGRSTDPVRVELTSDQRGAWLFPDPGRTWTATRHAGETLLRARVLEPGAWGLSRTALAVPPLIQMGVPFSRLLVANLGLPEEWRGRVYLLDPQVGGTPEQSVHFLSDLAEHLAPALTNVFLIGRLRARDTAAERARVARELHDGAIQALFGLEMKVEAVRRATPSLPPGLDAELEEMQDIVRREVLALRELMQALRPIPLDTSEQLPDVLASVVERFRRDTGVPARFVFSGHPVTIPPATALELVRIVQEALVNVRKHSRARNVLVRVSGTARGCSIAVEDDGVGFPFTGALSGEDLDQRRIGPAIIKERARMAGAALRIDSVPGCGARIELTLGSPT
jgi:signal transduction histidine kinase